MRYKATRIIHISDLLVYLRKKWKYFFIGLLIVSLLFGFIGIYKVQKKYSANNNVTTKEKVSVSGKDLDDVEAILTLEKAIKSQRAYNQNSILMKIDSNNKPNISLKYQFIISDDTDLQVDSSRIDQARKAYQNILFDEELYRLINDTLSTDIESKYLKELIGTETDTSGIIVYNITGNSEEMARGICDALKQYLSNSKMILKNYRDVKVCLDSELYSEILDMGLLGTQTNYHNNLQNLEATLETRLASMSDKAKEYLSLCRKEYENNNYQSGQILYKEVSNSENVNMKRKIYEVILFDLKRVVLFSFLFLIFWTLKYLFTQKLMCTEDLKDMFGIRVLGFIKSDKTDKLEYTAEKLVRLAGTKQQLGVLSTCKDEILEIMNHLCETIRNHNLNVNDLSELNEIELLHRIKDCEGIVLVEKIGSSSYDSMEVIINQLQEFEMDIIGAIVVDS